MFKWHNFVVVKKNVKRWIFLFILLECNFKSFIFYSIDNRSETRDGIGISYRGYGEYIMERRLIPPALSLFVCVTIIREACTHTWSVRRRQRKRKEDKDGIDEGDEGRVWMRKKIIYTRSLAHAQDRSSGDYARRLPPQLSCHRE